MKGSYFLILKLREDRRIKNWNLRKGIYLYVGSGMKEMESRVSRHLMKRKTKHWHIDYLTSDSYCEPVLLLVKFEEKKMECKYARKFNDLSKGIRGFGCSDCNCHSHLFYFNNMKECIKAIEIVLGNES